MDIKNKLWVESYRPKTIDEYVFVDERQKQQILSWLKDGICPNSLFIGSAGTGKCLTYNEMIDIEIDVNTLTAEQIEKLKQWES
jgi:DNA polymerase III delta prime subunit